MRKTFFLVANSLDNFIAKEDGGVDWLRDSTEAHEMLEKLWKNVDTVVMGRTSYEFSAAHGMEGFPGVENYVLSSTLKQDDHKKVMIVSEDTAAFVRGLKEQEGGDICVMGGAQIAKDCIAGGVLDELHVNIHPTLLGSGAPLFLELDEPIDLELLECRPLPHGCVALAYRVKC